MACAYLLSLDDSPTPPKLKRSMTKKEWAAIRADKVMDAVKTEELTDDTEERAPEENGGRAVVPEGLDSRPRSPAVEPKEAALTSSPTSLSAHTSSALASEASGIEHLTGPEETVVNSSSRNAETSQTSPSHSARKGTTIKLDDVLDLHTSRRMKSPSQTDQKLKQGVSIPSQRRWLYYWSLILSHESPPGLWGVVPPSPGLVNAIQNFSSITASDRPKVRLRQVTVRLRELTGIKKTVVKFANTILDRSSPMKDDGKGSVNGGMVWVSLARYDDQFVDTLEKWEKHTRAVIDGEEHLGIRQPGSVSRNNEELSDMFNDGKWDKTKMIRSFARLGAISKSKHKQKSEVRLCSYLDCFIY